MSDGLWIGPGEPRKPKRRKTGGLSVSRVDDGSALPSAEPYDVCDRSKGDADSATSRPSRISVDMGRG